LLGLFLCLFGSSVRDRADLRGELTLVSQLSTNNLFKIKTITITFMIWETGEVTRSTFSKLRHWTSQHSWRKGFCSCQREKVSNDTRSRCGEAAFVLRAIAIANVKRRSGRAVLSVFSKWGLSVGVTQLTSSRRPNVLTRGCIAFQCGLSFIGEQSEVLTRDVI
jgi:hypothetical protein